VRPARLDPGRASRGRRATDGLDHAVERGLGGPADAAEAGLGQQQARADGSTKYQALARLGRRPEAAELAAASGSDYLLAQVARRPRPARPPTASPPG
jgi:hypothetical protein